MLVTLACLSSACSAGDRQRSTAADSAAVSRPTASAKDSSSPAPTVAATVARWRGSTIPDHIDSLMATAFSTEGAFTGDDEMYDFSGNKTRFEELGNVSLAVPRLVDCLGWDQRAAATYRGARLLVGVICDQALIRNPKIQKLLTTLGPGGYPDVSLDYRNPAIAEVRNAQLKWRKLLLNQPL